MLKPSTRLLLIACCLASTPALARHDDGALYRESELIVKYRDIGAAKSASSALGMVAKRSLQGGRLQLLQLPAITTVDEAISLLMQDPRIEYAEPNYRRRKFDVRPNDPLFDLQWGLLNTGQANFVPAAEPGVAGADLNLPRAWDADNDGVADRIGNPSVIVAVIDDGVELSHEDLAANLVPGYDFKDDDADPSPVAEDDDFHGTAVAGCVGAVGNNGLGVAGVAWNARIMPLRFDYDVITHVQALEYARDHGAKIINASFGGPGFSQTELDAIRALAADDILYVASAGNDDSNIDRGQINYPANYDADNIVAVASTSRQGQITSFSQYGPLTVDVAAPGLQIITTAVGNTYTSPDDFGISGTSFSAPYVAGVAALIRSHVPGADFSQIKARLIESGQNGANARDLTIGGRVDADLALDMAARPSLVVESVQIDSAGNGVLDPGETATVNLVVRNLWQAASDVRISGSADSGLIIDGGPIALGTLAPGQRATARLRVRVPADISGHQYVHFAFDLSAAGGYSTRRAYVDEVAKLTLGRTVTQTFAGRDVDLYDEYQAWHVQVPAGPRARFLVVDGTADADIDLLVKRDQPPRYDITVGIDPEADDGFFCTSGTAPGCADPGTTVATTTTSGLERACIELSGAGTYHIVVVNFAQLDRPLSYQLRAYRANTCGGASLDPEISAGGGGGGAPGPRFLLLLALAAALRAGARIASSLRASGRLEGACDRPGDEALPACGKA